MQLGIGLYDKNFEAAGKVAIHTRAYTMVNM